MEVQITGRHEELTDSVKEYAQEKLGALSRFHKGLRALEVVFTEDSLEKSVELIAHLSRGAPIVVTAKHEEPLAAVDLAHDKLERVLKKEKEKRRDLARHKGPPPGARAGEPPARGPGSRAAGGGE